MPAFGQRTYFIRRETKHVGPIDQLPAEVLAKLDGFMPKPVRAVSMIGTVGHLRRQRSVLYDISAPWMPWQNDLTVLPGDQGGQQTLSF